MDGSNLVFETGDTWACLDCGYENPTGTLGASWIIDFGGVRFEGCPKCMGNALATLLGKTKFGNMAKKVA